MDFIFVVLVHIPEADYQAIDIRQHGTRMQFAVALMDRSVIEVDLALPGLHNVRNALAAITVADKVGIAPDSIVKGLRNFGGIGRRFEILGEIFFDTGRALLVDELHLLRLLRLRAAERIAPALARRLVTCGLLRREAEERARRILSRRTLALYRSWLRMRSACQPRTGTGSRATPHRRARC